MRILLLLTIDPSLEREVEELTGNLPGPLTLLPLQSPGQVDDTLRTLDNPALLLVDAACFPPPGSPGAPVLMIGASGQDPVRGVPTLERPLRSGEFHSLTDWMFDHGGPSPSGDRGGSPGFLPPAFSAFQRDVVHDLNNQLTTLQGNLILMAEESEDPTLTDMLRASGHAARLTTYLEWLGEGGFSSETLPLGEFLDPLLPLFHRLRERRSEFQFEIEGASDPRARVCPSLLMGILVGLVYAIPGHPRTIRLSLRSDPASVPVIRCTWPPSGEWTVPPADLPDWVARAGGVLELQDAAWELRLRAV